MRFAFCALAVAACAPPIEIPQPGPTVTLELPFEPLDSHGIYLVGQLDAGVIRFDSTVTYGLGPGFPVNVRIDGEKLPAYIGNCFSSRPGSVRWTSIDQGTVGGVAHVQLGQAGDLDVVILDPGTTRYVLRGEFTQPDGGRCGSPLPFVHALTFQVTPVTAARFTAPFGGCAPTVLPTGTEVRLPYTSLVGPDGGLFNAENARRQTTVTVSGPIVSLDGGAFRLEGSGDVTFTAGAASMKYTVASPAQLSAFEAHWAKHRYSKSEPWVPLEPGTVDLSNGNNSLALIYDQAKLGADKLCQSPPPSWYRMTSLTPDVCTDEGSVVNDGQCRLTVTVPGSNWSWSLDAPVIRAR